MSADRWYLTNPACVLHYGAHGCGAIYCVDIGKTERLLVVRADGREVWTNRDEIARDLLGKVVEVAPAMQLELGFDVY